MNDSIAFSTRETSAKSSPAQCLWILMDKTDRWCFFCCGSHRCTACNLKLSRTKGPTCLSLPGTILPEAASQLRRGACQSFTARFRSPCVRILPGGQPRAKSRFTSKTIRSRNWHEASARPFWSRSDSCTETIRIVEEHQVGSHIRLSKPDLRVT